VSVDAVVKLGGSLLGERSLPSLLGTLGGLAKTERLVVVPGGGPFANAVRRASAFHDPGADAAHWMAILAMDQHAHLLTGLLPAARLVVDLSEIAATTGERRLAVLAPFAWLRAADALPHGWEVTSDSIAAWVAGQLAARRLVLLKAVEGVAGVDGDLLPEGDPRSATLAGILDEYFPRALPPGIECWILSGRHPERLGELLRSGRARGTRVR
jgi:aspartokinase-like uncharacterized kinase